MNVVNANDSPAISPLAMAENQSNGATRGSSITSSVATHFRFVHPDHPAAF
jgi:hypothetical protein